MKKSSPIYRRVQLKFPQEMNTTFQKYLNYLDTNQSGYVYILFYLGKDKSISEEELREYKKLIDKNEEENNLLLSITKPMINDIKERPRYEFQLYLYISYIIYREFKNEQKFLKNEKNQSVSRLIKIPKSYAEKIDNLKIDYRISFSTLVNYGFSNNYHKQSNNEVEKVKNNIQTKSVTVIPEVLKKIEIPAEKRAKQIENIIDYFV